MRAMILAAGRGERLRPLTDKMPKVLAEVGGDALIERHLRMLAACGVDTVVINLGWLGEQLVERLGGGDRFGLRIIYSPEYDNILETAGGIQRALPMLGQEPFWVINGDVFTDFCLDDMEVDGTAPGHLLLVPTPDWRERGDFDLDDGLLQNGPQRRYTFAGIARYSPLFFAGVQPGRAALAPLLRTAADAGHLRGVVYDGIWEDVGTPERLGELNARYSASP